MMHALSAICLIGSSRALITIFAPILKCIIRPYVAVFVEGEGAYLAVRLMGVLAHLVVAVEEDFLSVLLGQDVDTTAVGGHPDVAVFVFEGIISAVGRHAPFVVVDMIVALQRPAASGLGRHLK